MPSSDTSSPVLPSGCLGMASAEPLASVGSEVLVDMGTLGFVDLMMQH
jgi:hypothetical protein